MQVSARDDSTGLVRLLNAASATMRGSEIEIQMVPNDELSVRMFATYLDAEYDEFPGADVVVPIGGNVGNVATIIDASGNDVIRAPEYSVNLSLDYSIPTKYGLMGLSGNVFHSAEYYWDFNNRLSQPAYTLINAEASWTTTDEKYRVSIWGKNLTDEDVFQQMLPATWADVVSYEKPVTYGISATVRF